MKKILSGLLVMMLLMSGMIKDNNAMHKITSVDFYKTVQLDNGTLLPKEDFVFSMEPADVNEGEVLNYLEVRQGIDLKENSQAVISYNTADTQATQKASFDLSGLEFEKEACIYRYEVKESAGTSASMTYDNTSYLIDVYVANTGYIEQIIAKESNTLNKKIISFTNVYETEQLEINKKVEGLFADKNKDFTFRLTLNGVSTLHDGTVLNALKTKQDGTSEELEIIVGNENVFTLKHNEYLIVDNLPHGLTYEVSEDYSEGYTSTMTDISDGVIGDNGSSVQFINSSDDIVETGISMEMNVYLLSLIGVGSGYIVLSVLKKKSNIEN